MTPTRAAEIARDARDKSHLRPNPIRCVAGGYVCEGCGATVSVTPLDNLHEWLRVHGGCRQSFLVPVDSRGTA